MRVSKLLVAVVALASATLFARDTAIYNGKLTSAMNANGMAITNAPTPVRAGDLVNKAYVDGIAGITPSVVTNVASYVTTNTVTKEYVEGLGIKGGGSEYSWMRPNDWCVDYSASNQISSIVYAYNIENNSGQIFTNEVTTLVKSRAGVARVEKLDPTSEITPFADNWRSLSQGLTIDQNGVFNSLVDGLYRIEATKGTEKRYADIAVQLTPNETTTNTIYWADAVGSTRKAVNDAAKVVLMAATTNSVHTYDGKQYTLYNTYTPRMTSTGAGNVSAFAVSPHVLASADHYAVKVTGNQTFNDGNGNVVTVRKLPWVNLYNWAITNGFSEAECNEAGIRDINLIPCAKTTAVPDGCIPWFMSENTRQEKFGDTMEGLQAWFYGQSHNQAIPYVLKSATTGKHSPAYYQTKLTRADICARLKEMGVQYPIHSGDSGKPCWIMVENKPVVLFSWWGIDWGRPDNYVKGFRMVKAFVEWYGDQIKEYK